MIAAPDQVEVISATAFRVRAYELLRRVQAGESFLITRYGRPVALLGPLPSSHERPEPGEG